MKRYKSRVKQYRQNRTFKNNQKALYEELDEKMRQEQATKAPRPDGLHGFWLKRNYFHQAMVKHLDDCIQTGDVPSWMVESWTLLIQKDTRKVECCW